MAAEGCWEEFAQESEVVGVVEDEQPVGVGGEPAEGGLDGEHLVLGVLLGEVEAAGESDVADDERFAGVGQGPEDGLVGCAVAVGVFERKLRFADATQAADGLGLREGGGLAGLESLSQSLQDLFAAREKLVGWVGGFPDRREGCGRRAYSKTLEIFERGADASGYLRKCLISIGPLRNRDAICRQWLKLTEGCALPGIDGAQQNGDDASGLG